MNTFSVMYHPKTGETYAVELGSDVVIIKAAGPMPYTESNELDVLINWLDNSDMSGEDGAWVEEEFNRA